jgi:alpha-ribazole phosphatase
MQVYLVRHTKTVLPEGICYGISDIALAEDFQNKMNDVVQKLKHLKNPVVYSSPLTRCRLLAEKISDKITIDDRLREMNFGIWELQSWDNIKGPEAEKWMNDFVNVPCPVGESYTELCTRVRSFLSDLICLNTNTVIIVTHAGIIRAMISLRYNIPLHQSFNFQIGFGEIFDFDCKGPLKPLS